MPAAVLPHVHDTGAGPAVLLLHAFPLDASQWDNQVARLSDRYRCIRPDAYGCGASPAPPPGLTLEDMARALVGVLDERGIERVAVVGLSMGGYTTFALLRAAADRVAALVLASTRAGADGEAARADRLAMAAAVRRDGVEPIVEPTVARLLSPRGAGEFHVSDPVRGRIRRCTAVGVATCQEAMAARPDSTALLASIGVPTLCVAGAEDAVTPPEVVEGMAASIPGARFEVVEGAGHLVDLERPEEFSLLVGGFLDQVAERGDWRMPTPA